MEKRIRLLSNNIKIIKESVNTEEGTKTAFVLPFLQILGYDVFNPFEVKPEVSLDVGGKKGEKVDYVIYKNDEPVFIIECKKHSENINNHKNQLIRYFHTSNSKFAILTNGLVYQFYTDIQKENVLDEDPFFTFNILSFESSELDILKLIYKDNFSKDILKSFSESVEQTSNLKTAIVEELSNPSKELITLIIKKVHDGRITKKIYNEFESKIIKSLTELYQPNEEVVELDNIKKVKKVKVDNNLEETSLFTKNPFVQTTDKFDTTQEEVDFFNSIMLIIPEEYKELIYCRDFKSYFGIFYTKSITKCVCKAFFDMKKKHIGLFDDDGKMTKIPYNGTTIPGGKIIDRLKKLN